MANKIKPGVLCTGKTKFKDWFGYVFFTTANKKLRWEVHYIENRYCTVLRKKSFFFFQTWVSFTEVLAISMSGMPIKVWIVTNNLKPVLSQEPVK